MVDMKQRPVQKLEGLTDHELVHIMCETPAEESQKYWERNSVGGFLFLEAHRSHGSADQTLNAKVI